MSTARGAFTGQTPNVLVQPAPPKNPHKEYVRIVSSEPDLEKAKYEKMWAVDAYRNCAPGEGCAEFFLKLANPSKQDTIIDFGAGTGRGALLLALFGGGCKVHMVDFARNCLDDDIQNALVTQSNILSFTEHDLRKPLEECSKFGFCTDVMEHIPPTDVNAVMHHILKAAQFVFFQISTVPDHFGATIGESLHLTVQPYQWWLDKLHEHEAVVLWSAEQEGQCAFFVTAWQSVPELIRHGTLNTEEEEQRNNIKSAIARNLTEARPYEKTDIPVIFLAGGPSLNDYADEIVERRKAGAKLITVNGAYNWAIEHGITPSATIVVDSREFNKRFVQPTMPNCQYLLGSQCNPAIFDAVPADQTLLWHSALDEEMIKFLEENYLNSEKVWYPVLGGSTVMLRALPLMVLLGYSKFEVYGFDSCLMDKEHHSYPQIENDHQTILQVLLNDRTFNCHPWMVSQAQEFLDLMQLMAEHIELNVHGDGLIAWMIKTAAEMGDAELEVVPI